MVFYNKIDINIPNSYNLIATNSKDFDYTYQNSDKSTIFISLLDNNLTKDKVIEKMQEYKTIYNRIVPGFIFGDMRIIKKEEINICIMSFKFNAVDSDIFSILSVLNCDNKELVIKIDCEFYSSYNNINEYIKILNSIKAID